MLLGLSEGVRPERIEVRWFKPAELDVMIREGKIQDGKTIIAFLSWQRDRRARKTSAAKPERGG